MRISLIMTAGGAGGLQQSVIPYATALRRSGHEVQLVMWAQSPLLEEAEARGLSPVKLRKSLWPGIFTRRVRAHMADFRPDAVIGFAAKGFPVARRAAPEGVPVFTRVGTMNADRLRKLLLADGLIVTSEEMRDLALALGAASTKVAILPNFILDGISCADRAEHPVTVVGSLGRLVPRKGYDLLLQAAGHLKAQGYRFELVIAGTGPEEGRLKELAQSLGLAVQWPGWISNSEKADFFAKLDVFVNPARDEPFGFVFLEAMSAGLAVVAADTVGARAIFTHEKDGLVAAHNDAGSLAEAIGRLVTDASLRNNLALAAKRTYHRSYTVEAAATKLDQILREWTGHRSV